MGRSACIALLPLAALALLSVPLGAQAPDPYLDDPGDAGVAASGGGDAADAGSAADEADGGANAADGAADEAEGGAANAAAGSEEDDYEPLSETVARCVAAFRDAQKQRRKGKLSAARTELLACVDPECPAILTDKCSQWIREVDDAMPSIVVEATDPAGRATTAVQVTADGRLLRQQLTDQPLELDPGDHLLRFEHPGSPVHRKWLVLRPGEKRRRITLAFTEAPQSWYQPTTEAAPPPRDQSIWTPLAISGLSVAAAGLTLGTITGIVAMNELAEIEQDCPDDVCPRSLEDDFDRAAAISHVSTGGFVVGGVAGAVGILALVEAAVRAGTASEDHAGAPPPSAIELRAGTTGLSVRGWF
ncbi:MAG: hypothetical protein JRI23_33815 [Deltaproteobacteria bacterium]|jgi:hypothetical protein|nr:hypothetical protein [Deltaproteobacteria bacterium]MBW2537270.1 hypothetical protein [Deltaproteobacteria bacterium]